MNVKKNQFIKWRYQVKIMVNKVDGNNYYVYTKQKKIEIPDTDEKFSLGYQKNESSSDAKDKKEISEQEKQQTMERSGVRLELSVGGQAAEADRQKQAASAKTQNERASGQTPLLETIRAYILAAITAVREFFHNIWNDPQENISQDSPLTEEILQDEQLLESTSEDMQSLEGAAGDNQSMEIDSQTEQLLEIEPQNISSIEEILQKASSTVSQDTAEIIDASDEISVLALEEERRNREIQQSLRDGDMEHVINLLTDNGRKTIAKNSTLLTSYDKNGRVVEPSASDRERALYGDRNTWKL